MQVEVDLDNLDNTQVSEPDGKRWKRDIVAKVALLSCAEEAASKATKEMASLMMEDAEYREKRFVESNGCMMEHLNGVVKGFPTQGVTDLEAKTQIRCTAFEKKGEKEHHGA